MGNHEMPQPLVSFESADDNFMNRSISALTHETFWPDLATEEMERLETQFQQHNEGEQ